MKSDSILFRLVAGILLAACSQAFGPQTVTLKVKTITGRAGVFG
ncbi:MAG TPA: hypothetical protein VMR62_26440 [Bryobacteraceae bacterium]|jgi:uncharacterized lipoprotein YajG|nr:hypothetical protein [Bryobacteraceae bacterium]